MNGDLDTFDVHNQILVCAGYDHTIRWQPGERLHHLFEQRCDRMQVIGQGDHLAVDAGEVRLTYDELDARANQLARHLLARGVRPGDRIGLLFDQAVRSYVGMLAVLKVNAAYVPLDVGFPADRLAYIAQDAGARMVLTMSHLRDRLGHLDAEPLYVDEVDSEVAAEPAHRLTDAERGDPVDDLCYIIYTSGSTGRPKGVAIEHASIVNFLRVAAEVYGMRMADRVYQGMTIAFDFSVEEIWVPWMVGATLVPKPGGVSLLGADLHDFLRTRGVTALCCVPTLLATIDDDLPGLRFLLVSGEACPQDLVARWHQPDRRFLNVYGPTETTVTATWAPLHPDRPVTLGVPLPTYSAVVLDPAEEMALPPGEMGEIGIAGIGLSSGYVNRQDLTDRAFVRDFLGIDGNPSARIYRTGDLGRVNERGEIEYHGRIDSQVKIRGYRIELTEIESVLMQVPGIAQAVVTTYEPEPGDVELAAYYSLRRDAGSPDRDLIYDQLRDRLPGYMVPAYLEELEVIPTLPSDKADRKSLPPPKSRRSLATRADHVEPTTAGEKALAEALAHVLRVDRVSADAHFFDDLGANSLLLARFCSRVRLHTDLPSVSMQDVYLNPTVRKLAANLAEAAPVPTAPPPTRARRARSARSSTAQYVLCGALQLTLFVVMACFSALILVTGYEWIADSNGLVEIYRRSLEFGSAAFVLTCTVPILAKWMLVGRWKRQRIAVWSLAYFRFWVVKTLIRSNPLVLFVGSPVYSLYLRALGARIGRGVVILSRNVPVCTDLLTIGEDTIIRKDSSFTCYRVRAGVIHTGSVTLGKDVYVGEKTLIDIETSMGDGAQLGNSSCLHTSQAVPDGEHWHGSPAQRTEADYRTVAPARCGRLKRFTYGLLQVLNALVVYMPIAAGGLVILLVEVPHLNRLIGPDHDTVTSSSFYFDQVIFSSVLYFGGLFVGLAVVVTVPRLLNLAVRPGKVYALYGIHYWVQRMIARMTNRSGFVSLFGDSSYITHYLRGIGWDLSRVEQTGSNFGMAVAHESPFLSSVGTGTMVSDGLSMINADFSSTSFRVARASIGPRNFLGNLIAYPSQGRTGDNCLLATKVMIPIDGEVRENVGLLGSPCFEIPRSVQRDSKFDHLKDGAELRRRLASKTLHNTVTIALHIFVRWVHLFAVTLLALVAVDVYHRFGLPAIALAVVLSTLFSAAFFTLVDRAVTGFRPLRPKFCSIYDLSFWRHERYWKVPAMRYVQVLNGTPFKNLIWRLLGVRIGRRVFDDGCWITERSLVSIGDDCTLNEGSIIQSHSLEDGTFKSDHINIGARCTVGAGALVHYGVTMGDGAELGPDSFLMKGEEVAPYAQWRGNPARESRDVRPFQFVEVAPTVMAASAAAEAQTALAASSSADHEGTTPSRVIREAVPPESDKRQPEPM
ncbi:Pls/PosA family non-ribosomal peptide synthetase [Phytohabitans kaempferiae]|uniref:Pls/PosA family non-ribosomal peptide synthetase n=1 Tax=Phytohabitans kaempferiae TaxID=1620943 RepID=A0ABV6MCH9_9ACTN